MATKVESPKSFPDEIIERLHGQFGPSPNGQVLVVRIAEQKLDLYRHGKRFRSWPVSTSRYGAGNEQDSLKTPLGAHRIAQKIGAGAPQGTVFKGRKDTHQTVEIRTDDTPLDGDYITSRILWMEGLEPGVNKGPGIDSFDRYIYIHGTPEEGRVGTPASNGCIRMRNADVIELFDLLEVGTLVDICG